MAKSIKDYEINFPYGATSAPYTQNHPHRGNDRAAPCGTPIVIGSTTIGKVGTTGLSTGCHLHTQGARPGGYITFNPTVYEFQPGTVVETGFHGDFGNYVRIRVNSKVDIIYAHLSQINVRKGQTVGEDMYKGQNAKHWYLQYVKERRKVADREKESNTWRRRYYSAIDGVWAKVKTAFGK